MDSSTGGSGEINSRAVISGGAGFVGSHLCEALAASATYIVVLDNLITGARANLTGIPNVDLRVVDVSEGAEVEGRVDMVMHLASLASPADYALHPIETLKAGTLGTVNMLELARKKGARFLFTSTSEVYGDPLVHPQPEAYWGNVNPIGPRSCYDESKRCGEAFVMAYLRTFGLDTRIVRIFNTYGPRMRLDDSRAVPALITQALQGRPLTVHGSGEQTRSLCYVDDLIAGILLVLERGDHMPYNLGIPHEITVIELARTIRRLAGSSSKIEHHARPADDPSRRRPATERAAALGWHPGVGLEEGLTRTIADMRRVLATPAIE